MMLRSVLDPLPAPGGGLGDLPSPSLPTPHPSPSPVPIPRPDRTPLPQPSRPSPSDLPPAHSPLPPTHVPPLPGIPDPAPPSREPVHPVPAAEAAAAEDDAIAVDAVLGRIVNSLPRARFVAAYGSAVFPQPSPSSSSSSSSPLMLDLLLAVDDPQQWHAHNLRLHPSHYSFLKHLGGASTIAYVQSLPAGLYYNTNVELLGRAVKYGVIATEALHDDLSRWSTLYVSGRLHKPVRVLTADAAVERSQHRNLHSAVTLSALLSPSVRLHERELFVLLTSLSYTGDVRMGIAEDPLKIARIVQGSYAQFRRLYNTVMQETEWMHREGEEGKEEEEEKRGAEQQGAELRTEGQRKGSAVVWRVKDSEADRRRMVESLPSHLLETLWLHDRQQRGGAAGGGGGQAWGSGLSVVEQQLRLRQAVASIVHRSSSAQSFKGLLTAGIRKSLYYGWRKLAKARY